MAIREDHDHDGLMSVNEGQKPSWVLLLPPFSRRSVNLPWLIRRPAGSRRAAGGRWCRAADPGLQTWRDTYAGIGQLVPVDPKPIWRFLQLVDQPLQ